MDDDEEIERLLREIDLPDVGDDANGDSVSPRLDEGWD
jgi:hypothetical protein